MKRKIVTIIMLLFLLTGCGEIEIPPIPTPRPTGNAPLTQSISKNMDIDLYLDSTVSMSGFAVSNVTTSYVNTIADISSIATTLSGNLGKIHYYSFGETIEDLETQERFSNARKQEFYDDDIKNNRKTCVSEVIKNISDKFDSENADSKLSIVITDLFEDNSNVDPLIQDMKKSYDALDLSIGVLGVKSYFKGWIYDIGRNTKGKPYESDLSNPLTFRPFYVLIFGKPGNVLKYYEKLNELSLQSVPQCTKCFELYSKYCIMEPGVFTGKSEIKGQDKKRPKIKQDDEFFNNEEDKGISSYKVYIGGTSEEDKVSEIIAADLAVNPVNYTRLKYAIDGGGNIYENKTNELLKTSIKLEKYEKKKFVPVEKKLASLKISKACMENGKLKTEVSINPYGLETGYYRINLTVNYDDELLNPIIPADWNMKDENDSLFGCKTIYLYNLLEGFYGLAKGLKQPLAEVYYYLKVLT